MRLPLEWLQQFIDLKKISTKQLANLISLRITEVEQIIDFSSSDVRVGEVKSIKAIAKTKKLSQAKIDIGNKIISIVFSNDAIEIKPGDRLPIAITPTKEFFNVHSQGMLVSNNELGLFLNDDNILKFRKDVRIGTNVYQYLNFNPILDLKVTPNRGDLLNLNGFARDLSAILNKEFYPTIIPQIDIESKNLTTDFDIEVSTANNIVPRYSAIKISGIKNGYSPVWMQKRLLESGLRPINAIVDITNYVMIELGQPLHAFDFDNIVATHPNHRLYIRFARQEENFTSLDNVRYKLDADSIVIADQEQILALAGIMGGRHASVSNNTQEIILESAIFDPILIRKTAKRLALNTDASYRFERKIDPEITVSALKRATELILTICGGRVTSKIFDIKTDNKSEKIRINFSLERFSRQTGSGIKINNIVSILRRLGFHINKKAKTSLEIQPPSWRHDISLEEDIYEEILRVEGFENLNQTLPKGSFGSPFIEDIVKLENEIALISANLQFNEVVNFSFYGEKDIIYSQNKPRDHIKLKNPLGEETSYLRSSLLPGIIKSIKQNVDNDQRIALFEIGHVFLKSGNYWQETSQVCLVVLDKDSDYSIRLLKLVLDRIFSHINTTFKIVGDKKSQAIINNRKEVLGEIFLVDPELIKFDKRKRQMVVLRLNLDKLLKIKKTKKTFLSINPLPKIIRDVTLIVPNEYPAGLIISKLNQSHELISNTELKDVYYLDNSKEKSINIRLTYQSDKKTLEDKEINVLHENIISQIIKDNKIKIKNSQ